MKDIYSITYDKHSLKSFAVNQPPQFTIPAAVYAILNKDFEIQIYAVDPKDKMWHSPCYSIELELQ